MDCTEVTIIPVAVTLTGLRCIGLCSVCIYEENVGHFYGRKIGFGDF